MEQRSRNITARPPCRLVAKTRPLPLVTLSDIAQREGLAVVFAVRTVKFLFPDLDQSEAFSAGR